MPQPRSVRLLHDTIRVPSVITVMHPYRPYDGPQDKCPTCRVKHANKTWHLRVESDGSIVVSYEVFKGLKECGLPNMAVESEVTNPPPATISLRDPANPKVYVEKPKIRLHSVGV